MDLTILSRNFQKLGVIDETSSVIWHRKYSTAGQFSLTLPQSENNIELIQKQNIVHKPGSDEAGVIDTFYLKRDADGEEIIEASGYFLTGLLARRIIPKQTTLNDTYRNIMHTLVNSNAVTAAANRVITGLRMPALAADTSSKVRLQVTGKNLLSYLEGLSLVSGIGYKVLYKRHYMEFSTYQGVDRSVNQSINPRVVFSEEYDNLTAAEYTYSEADKVTAVYVAGEGEGLDRTIVEVDDGSTGWDRFETWNDARASREEKMTDAEYLQLLQENGLEVQSPAAENFSGSIVDNETMVYKKDFDLGDIVTVFSRQWNKKISVRITEVEEVDEGNSSKVVIYVGSTEPTISDILKSDN
ncbi:MAG: siphovirus ReqiPepy6 Gp37-like family protein [Lachnospiraceae bacterium]